MQIAEPLATPEIVMRAPQMQDIAVGSLLLAVWAIGAVLLIATWLVHWMRIRAAVKRAVPAGIEAPITVKSTPVLWEPGIVGIVRPVLVLPDGMPTYDPQPVNASSAPALPPGKS